MLCDSQYHRTILTSVYFGLRALLANLSDPNPPPSTQTAAHPNSAFAPPKRPNNVIAYPPACAVAPRFVRCDRGIELWIRARASGFGKLFQRLGPEQDPECLLRWCTPNRDKLAALVGRRD